MPLATRCRVALRRATSSASSDVSVATIATAARSCAIDTATQPLPVQTSAMFGAASRGISASASSTSSSVSGRGISTAGVTSNQTAPTRCPKSGVCLLGLIRIGEEPFRRPAKHVLRQEPRVEIGFVGRNARATQPMPRRINSRTNRR